MKFISDLLIRLKLKTKPRCLHPNLAQKFFWSGGPMIESSCSDCGMFDRGTVISWDTEEEWLAHNK